MGNNTKNGLADGSRNNNKVLLVLLPYWDPLIPPHGISCLKSFLRQQGHNVHTIDMNIEDEFRIIYDSYFQTLKQGIPKFNQANFYNIGHHAFRDHLLAQLNQGEREDTDYIELVKTIIYNTFYFYIDTALIQALNKLLRDFYIRLEEFFLELLEHEQPAVLGLSVNSGTLPASLHAFRITKQKYPHIMTVMGGSVFVDQLAIGSPNLEYFLEKTPFIDKIIIGEGELLFHKLLCGELNPFQRVFTLRDIQDEVVNLSQMQVPDFTDLQTQYYPYLVMYASRSCPFNCSFCCERVLWGTYRKKEIRQVVQELSELHQQYGARLFLMGDALLNPIITDLASGLLESGLPIYFDGYLRADKHVCNLENALSWRRGGFYRARIGAESGSQHVLDLMDKRITPLQIKAAVSTLALAGIKTTTYWLIGHPGETEEDFLQTLNLIEELRDDIYEADPNPFYFYLSGQVNSASWVQKNSCRPLYGEAIRGQILIQQWYMEGEPCREEVYHRLFRFVECCQSLGIPNPYSLKGIQMADERWKILHKNAVPTLLELKDDKFTMERRDSIKELNYAQNTFCEEGDFAF
jgi:hypothetical protein